VRHKQTTYKPSALIGVTSITDTIMNRLTRQNIKNGREMTPIIDNQ